jgi:hypothetical protein
MSALSLCRRSNDLQSLIIEWLLDGGIISQFTPAPHEEKYPISLSPYPLTPYTLYLIPYTFIPLYLIPLYLYTFIPYTDNTNNAASLR